MLRSTACLLLTASLATSAWGQGRRAVVRDLPGIAVDDSDRVVLRHNVHPMARPQNDIGPMDVRLPLQRMVLVLTPGPTVERQLQQFLADLQDPASPNYQQWLTPQQFEQRFGVPAEQMAAVVDWLKSYGLTIDEIPTGGRAINFSGTVQQVERAFHVRMRSLAAQDRNHYGNDRDPSIPRALAGIVAGPLSLHDFRSRPLHTGTVAVPADYYSPQFTDLNGNHFLAPSDFATIYDVWRLYARGINGTGQSIAIVGRTDISLSDVQTFRTFFGLPANDPVFIHNGTPPGNLGDGEETEADLDVEWSGAVARNATIKFVISKSTATDGVDLSAQYIVANNVAPIISTSFGQCESTMGAAENTFWNNTWSQAAAQGQTAFVSSGDSGAAGCDPPSRTRALLGLAVSGLSSTPSNVAVGGSEFLDTANPSLYWAATNNAVQGSVLSYIPEEAWNESGAAGGSQLWATGGGASTVYAKPVWQAGPGVPGDSKRDVPDVSLSAAGHDGYIVKQADQGGSGLIAVGGTSASSPSFAGLMALVLQKTGSRQGNANPTFYAMANSQYANHGVTAFHDVTTLSNKVPTLTTPIGFNAGPAYDQATGLGTVDAFFLVTQWGQTPTGSGSGNANVVNGGFETGNLTGWTTGGALAPSASAVQKHTGSFSALLGASAAPEPNGDSFLSQDITLPGTFTSATLTFWYRPASTDSINYDWQEAQIQNTSGNTLAQVLKVCQNTQAWTQVTYDLTPYKGQTIRIYFNAHGDGFGDLTSMYVDDVSLTITP